MPARSSLSLHMPDADSLTSAELAATLDLAPSALLCLVYAQWDADKGAAEQISNLVRSLGHDRLYVRFHADPNPVAYARKIGGPEAWGRLCARRMGQRPELTWYPDCRQSLISPPWMPAPAARPTAVAACCR